MENRLAIKKLKKTNYIMTIYLFYNIISIYKVRFN